jgi:hypothetical protein
MIMFLGFSLMTLLPATVAFLSIPLAMLLLVSVLIFKFGIKVYAITFGLPTLLSMFCWWLPGRSTMLAKASKILLFVVLPLTCLALFVFNQHANGAWVYSCYWLIPVAIYFAPQNNSVLNLFGTAIASSFIAHAIGVILWMYAMPTTPEFWIALIPVVAVERFTSSMIVGFFVLGVNKIKNAHTHKATA